MVNEYYNGIIEQLNNFNITDYSDIFYFDPNGESWFNGEVWTSYVSSMKNQELTIQINDEYFNFKINSVVTINNCKVYLLNKDE